jgi:hypothetical protein
MTRRRLFLVAAFAVLVLVGIAAWVLWPTATTITRASFAQIHLGMTLEEVETVLGGPARDESTMPWVIDGPVPAKLGEPNHLTVGRHVASIAVYTKVGRHIFSRKQWNSGRLDILVDFDETERVSAKHIIRLKPADEGEVLSTLRRWLRL